MTLLILTAVVAMIFGFLIAAAYYRAVISTNTPIVIKGSVYKSEIQTLTATTEVVIKKPALRKEVA